MLRSCDVVYPMNNDNYKKKERGRRDSTQRDTRVKTGQNDATDVTSVCFETGQLQKNF
jgi:hypothetical protein